jgi:hypothetical protein
VFAGESAKVEGRNKVDVSNYGIKLSFLNQTFKLWFQITSRAFIFEKKKTFETFKLFPEVLTGQLTVLIRRVVISRRMVEHRRWTAKTLIGYFFYN